MKPIVFSGIRASGKLHLGNYLGAIKNWIELQDQADPCVFAVVDLHGITTPFDPKTYQQQTLGVILDFLAAGVDPKKAVLMRQSHVPQHVELAWLFNTITPISWLDRLPTYKEKLDQMKSGDAQSDGRAKSYQNNLAILAYPVLMAADILMYKANLVPVGEDQLVHIDVTNEIGSKFNYLFGETFPNVKAHINQGARIMSLQNPEKKMSKTGDDGIALSDDADAIRSKIKRAVTDSGKEVLFDEEKKPAISNLMTIYALLAPDIKNLKQIEEMYAGKSYADFKNDLAEVVVQFLKPLQERYADLKADMGQVMKILETSEEQARELANVTLTEAKQKMGLL